MELLWYDIRQLDEETMARTVAMMDETRRRRVSDIAGEDDRRRTVAGELLARRALAERLGCGEDNVPLRWDDTGKPPRTPRACTSLSATPGPMPSAPPPMCGGRGCGGRPQRR